MLPLSKPVNGTIPVQALLYDKESLYAEQDGVGIYNGQQKSDEHQNGTVYVSSHRLFYIDALKPHRHSFELDLSCVTRTEYYAGLFTSSSKITLFLSQDIDDDLATSEEQSWTCEVCDYKNPPSLVPGTSKVCALCGVPRSSSETVLHRSSSMPTSSPVASLATAEGGSTTEIACSACTFLNHSSMHVCEICGTVLPHTRHPDISMKSAPSSRPVSPYPGGEALVKLSFRKGGDKQFYTLLKRSLQGKAWESAGILQTVETSAQGQASGMKDALKDIDALMIKARDMVQLAADLNERLTAATAERSSSLSSSSNTEPESATFIRSSLAQLGLQMENTPVTQDMVKDERRWIDELARELARVLQGGNGGLMASRGIIALDEVWGGWNRARGVALIPPSTLLQIIPQLAAHTRPPVTSRVLSSGLTVLHTPPFSHAAFSARLLVLLDSVGPQNALAIARSEGVTIGLVTEMILAVEADGAIARDDSNTSISGSSGGLGGSEIRWWPNMLRDYVWDGCP
ncbi:hypothetical protein FISHEDRAFT_67272 [Fistulina hepatica ATCC 64428]|uniref:Vacuolar protein-sorting-associated protein 36 n=1 Tax=Fistulina hepatica ATCC 64428 TaxID=1128425 RepID=A0A0D7A2B2_9AGAR|nr:hypothetical protein FISHEDRAFT_67272 [Fistulina hepatica ATCC 64428]